MPLVVPEDFGQVIVSISASGDPDPWGITFGVFKGSESDPQELVDEVAAATIAQLKQIIDPTCRIGPTTLRLTQGGVPSVWVATENTAGTSIAEARLPQNCALLVHKRTNAPGRRGRGRIYLPSVPSGIVSNTGALSGDYIDEVQEILDDWLAALSAEPLPTVHMWLLHNTGVSATPDPNRVTSLTLDPIIATQRRRLRS